MTFQKIERHLKKYRTSYYRAVPLVVLALFLFVLTLHSAHPFTSAEVAFTDAAPSSGLAIVPASCPSSPDTGSCGCGPAPTLQCISQSGGGAFGLGGGSVCSGYQYGCPSGYTFDGNWCVVTGSACGTSATTCAIGYTYDAASDLCTFTGCPAEYTRTVDSSGYDVCEITSPTSCVPGLLCDTDGNLHKQSADCSIASEPATPLCQYGCAGSTCNPTPVPKVVTFSLAPSLVPSGKTTVVSWNVENVTDCTVTGSNTPPDSWTQPSDTTSWSGSGVSSSIVGQTIYTLHCTPIAGALGGNGAVAKWVDQTLTVNIVPTFHEQ